MRKMILWYVGQSTLENFSSLMPHQDTPLSFEKVPCEVTTSPKVPIPQQDEVVVVSGENSLLTLQQHPDKIVPKGRTIDSLRAYPIEHNGGYYYITYGPEECEAQYKNIALLRGDLNVAKQYVLTGLWEPDLSKCMYKKVQTLTEFLSHISYESATKIPVCLDLETQGNNPYNEDTWIISLQLSLGPHEAYFLLFDNKEDVPQKHSLLYDQIQTLLRSESVGVFGANLKFDLSFIKQKWGITCTNFYFDSTLIGSLLDENRSNSLENHSREMSDIPGYDALFNRQYNKAHMSLVPEKDLLKYACGDVDACFQVRNIFRVTLLKDKKLTQFYIHLLHPAARSFELIEETGVYINQEYFAYLHTYFSDIMETAQNNALRMLPQIIREKYADNLTISRAEIIKDVLFSHDGYGLIPTRTTDKRNEPKTDIDHLKELRDGNICADAKQFITYVETYRQAAKQQQTYVDGFLKHVCSDGRLHPSYYLFKGTEEFSSKNKGTVCFTKETLILTENGYLLFDDICVGDKVLTHKGTWEQITGKINNGVCPVYTVSLSNNMKINVTLNHPFLTTNGWKTTAMLDEKDKVYVYGDCEKFKPINNWNLFEISNWGRIRNCKTRIIRKQQKRFRKASWHLSITLYRNGAQKRNTGDKKDFYVHRLVANAFIPNPLDKPELDHYDLHTGNNCAWNLHWATSLENKQNSHYQGKLDKKSSVQAKLTWDSVNFIRKNIDLTDKQKAKKLGVSRELVRDVRNYKKWIHHNYTKYKYNFSPVSINSVVYAGEKETFGLCVKNNFSHITNGIITHNTGRISASNPSIQTVTKHGHYARVLRKAYIAPPGHYILQADLSQIELRLCATFSQDPVMLGVYRNNGDLHAQTGLSLYNRKLQGLHKPILSMEQFKAIPEYSEYRFRAKAPNFLLIFRGSAYRLQSYAKDEFGIDMSLEEAQEIHTAFFDEYQQLRPFHNSLLKHAKKYKYLRNPLGRIRHLPYIDSKNVKKRSYWERIAINYLMQSTASDIELFIIVLLHRHYLSLFTKISTMIHDSIISYIPKNDITEAAEIIVKTVHELPDHLEKIFGWKCDVPLDVECEYGENLAELEVLKV